jgi:hypothetical protein
VCHILGANYSKGICQKHEHEGCDTSVVKPAMKGIHLGAQGRRLVCPSPCQLPTWTNIVWWESRVRISNPTSPALIASQIPSNSVSLYCCSSSLLGSTPSSMRICR